MNKLHRIVAEVEAACSVKLNEIEYGPGLPVEYFDEDEERARSAQDEPVAELATLLDGFPFEGDVVLELGRSIAADCGAYLTSVVDVKTTSGQNYAIVDGGMHQISYYGHSMAMKSPVFRKVGATAGAAQPWNICGALCTVNDILAKQAPIVDLSVGRRACVLSGRRLLRNGGSGAVFKPGSSVGGRARRFGKYAHCSASAGNGLVQFIERAAG